MMKRIFSQIMQWIDRIRRVLVNTIFLLFLLIFVIALFAGKPEVPENGVLVLDLKGRLVEQLVRPDPGSFPFSLPSPDQLLMKDLVDVLKLAKDDSRIRMVRLDLEQLEPAPLAKLQDLRRAIDDFKQSGKPVIAAAHGLTQQQYYLAATANRIFLHPMGNAELSGYSLYRNYFKSLLDRLDVDIHLFRAGKFKSAAEPLVRDDMSAEDREANKAWLGTLWESYKADVAAMRGIDAGRLQQILDAPSKYLAEHDGNLARLLKAEGMVDELADKHDADRHIAETLGVGSEKDYPKIGYKAYLHTAGSALPDTSGEQLIGVVTAAGMILNGEQPSGTVGGDTVAGLLRKARLDNRIKAVVLRIDSPGGSALASEMIRKEVERLHEAGKPVVASMGSVAASGGYWIATTADEIWAQPTTITGSIGVFGAFAGLNRGLDALGIHTDGLGTTTIAGGLRADRPLHPELAAVFQMGVDETYREFLQHVAEGRHMEAAQAEALARGRVWSGADAKRLGLVDELGDLYAAITAAAKRAGIADSYKAIPIEPERKFADVLAESLFGEAQAKLGGQAVRWLAALPGGKAWLGAAGELALFARLNDPNNIYAYSGLPY